MTSSTPLQTVLAKLTDIDTASAAIQSVLGTYPSSTAGLAAAETYLASMNSASASLRAMATAASPTPLPTPIPTPVPTPPPVSPTSSGGSTLSPLRMLGDDFTGYANTTALLAVITNGAGGTAPSQTALYNDGANATLAVIDNTVLYNGHQTLKYTQPGGEANTPELWVDFKNGFSTQTLWFRAKIRFSPGFTTTGTLTNSANAYKLLGVSWNTYDGSGRLEITNTTQYQIGWTTLSKNGGATTGGGNVGIAGNITTEWTDGGWYDYIIEYDFSKSPGLAKVWMAKDGQTPVLKGTASGTMLNGLPLPELTGIMLALNFNQVRASNQSQAIWWGQWEAIDGIAHPNPYQL